MQTGTIKVIKQAGFGFITSEGRDLFFHVRESDLGNLPWDESLVGLEVEFDEETDSRSGKLYAKRVRLV